MVVSQNWQISGMDWCESGSWRCLLKVVDVIADVGELFYDLSQAASLTTVWQQHFHNLVTDSNCQVTAWIIGDYPTTVNQVSSEVSTLFNTIQNWSKNQIHKKITRKCKLGSKNRFASSFSRFADSLDFCSSVVKSAGSAHCPTSLFPPPAIIDAAQVQISERGWLCDPIWGQVGLSWFEVRCSDTPGGMIAD